MKRYQARTNPNDDMRFDVVDRGTQEVVYTTSSPVDAHEHARELNRQEREAA